MRLCIVTYLLFLFSLLCGQKRSAQVFFHQGLEEKDYRAAGVLFEKAIAKDSTYADAYLRLANVYSKIHREDLQVSILQLASKNCSSHLEAVNARLSRAAYRLGLYSIAKKAMSKLDVESNNELIYLNSCIDFSLFSIQQNLPFSPQNLGQNVNTEFDDYWPSFSIDESQLVTTVYGSDAGKGMLNEDFFVSYRDEGGWTSSTPMGDPLNTDVNEGAQCLSADGQLMLFTACDRRDGFGRCDLYISTFENGLWSKPRPLPAPINSPSWEGHPCLSADGRWLYFSSDRPGGFGDKDLYVVSVNLQNRIALGKVYNLGEHVNTQKDEICPFLHPDGQTLYFSSDGHIGLGRQDIYLTHKGDDGYRQEPINMGYPVNTHNEEVGLVVNAKGDVGYFSSERDDSRLKDIYSFTMPEKLRPQEVTYFKGNIYDSDVQKPVLAQVELRNVATGELLYSSQSSSQFVLPLPLGGNYAVHVSSPGYLFYSDNFPLSQQVKTPFEKNIFLSPIKRGEAIILKNILFSHDSFSLDSTFTEELDMVVELIKNNPALTFEVSGHTDNVGSADYNQNLSEKRALSVYQYIVDSGIDKARLSHVGYGSTRPISDRNDDNRRTELLVK